MFFLQFSIDFLNNFTLFSDSNLNQITFAIILMVFGVLLAKIASKILFRITKNIFGTPQQKPLKSLARLVEVIIFVVFLILALSALKVNFADEIVKRFITLLPSFLSTILLFLLGYVLINLTLDFFKGFFLKLTKETYFQEFGVSAPVIKNVFFVAKIFFILILLSISLSIANFPVPIIDSIITATVFSLIFFAGALIAFSFKDYLANFFLSGYISKNVLKPGQSVKIGEEFGEVVSVSTHGAVIELNSGYNAIIPNSMLVKQTVFVKRIRSDIAKLQVLRSKFVTQLPSHCGPASAAMMLSFFDFEVPQEEIARVANTKVPGGTEPEDLINAVRALTDNKVKGKLIRFDEIHNLQEEVKSWLSEGGLIILWYKKPVVFPQKDSKSGHYVLGVGVQDEEIIVMDPSEQTAGVMMINNKLLEEAMDEYDISRGYILFAKKGSPAYWRLSEGLIYSDVKAYKDISKSFERYLKRAFRERAMISELISEHIYPKLVKNVKVKQLWKPDLTASKRKRLEVKQIEAEKIGNETIKEKKTETENEKKAEKK